MKALFWSFLQILRGNGEVATRMLTNSYCISRPFFFYLVTLWKVATVNFALKLEMHTNFENRTKNGKPSKERKLQYNSLEYPLKNCL